MSEQSAEVGDLHVGTVVINVTDMPRAVEFWCAALGYRPRETIVDPDFTMLQDPTHRHPTVSLQHTNDARPKEPVRLHLDLYTDSQAAQVHRLVQLGASVAADWVYPKNPDFIVMRDPDGNEFCVINHADLE